MTSGKSDGEQRLVRVDRLVEELSTQRQSAEVLKHDAELGPNRVDGQKDPIAREAPAECGKVWTRSKKAN